MEQPESPPTTGPIAGKYDLIKMIGRGGMGSVWEGRHNQLGTRVAIKFIESEYAKSEEAVKRFKNEALAAAKIESKHAIKIHDYGVQDGKPFIVMEFLSGEPLDKRLERFGRLPPQDTARIMQQVCRALSRAHDQGIVHRDLKPENIFIVQEDDDEIAKVLDFGIAKMKDPSDQAISASTKTGAVLGTPYYMSPEQARGLRTIDHRTDLWSLGVIAFRCITGKLPFEGESLGDLLVKICTAPLPIPSQILPGLPLAFDSWFARVLDRDPNQRFGTAAELSDALAYACGISMRRGPGSGISSLPYPSPYHQNSSPIPTQPGPLSRSPSGGSWDSSAPRRLESSPSHHPSGAPNNNYSATSPPFVASANTTKSGSKGLIFAAVGAALIGVSLGVFGLVKLVGGNTNGQVSSKAAATTVVNTAPNGTANPPALTMDPIPLAPLTTAVTALPTATNNGGHAHPPPVVKASTTPVIPPPPVVTVVAPPPPVVTIVKPPPPPVTTKPNSSDPGF